MSSLEDLAVKAFGSLSGLARESGIDERALRDFAAGQAAPDKAHLRRLRQVLSVDVADLCPHSRPRPEVFPGVTDTHVLAARDEFAVRPDAVRAGDVIRVVSGSGPRSRSVGWTQVQTDAKWVSASAVTFTVRGPLVVTCHPAQVVTVARKRATPVEPSGVDSGA